MARADGTPGDAPSSDSEILPAAALREVADLHAFFEAWLGGTGAATPEAFARLEGALAPGFTMVPPSGERMSRDAVVGWLRGAHGGKGDPAPFHIRVEDAAVLHRAGPLVLVGYVEVQHRGAEVTRRRATAWLEADPAAPGAMRWLAVHETWMA